MRGPSVDSVFAGAVRDEEGLEYHHPDRIRQDIEEALGDEHRWLKAEYSCALHCEYLLELLEAHGIAFDGSPVVAPPQVVAA